MIDIRIIFVGFRVEASLGIVAPATTRSFLECLWSLLVTMSLSGSWVPTFVAFQWVRRKWFLGQVASSFFEAFAWCAPSLLLWFHTFDRSKSGKESDWSSCVSCRSKQKGQLVHVSSIRGTNGRVWLCCLSSRQPEVIAPLVNIFQLHHTETILSVLMSGAKEPADSFGRQLWFAWGCDAKQSSMKGLKTHVLFEHSV